MIGRHPATGQQALAVVTGAIEVWGGDGRALDLTAGQLVVFDAGEEHETRAVTQATLAIMEWAADSSRSGPKQRHNGGRNPRTPVAAAGDQVRPFGSICAGVSIRTPRRCVLSRTEFFWRRCLDGTQRSARAGSDPAPCPECAAPAEIAWPAAVYRPDHRSRLRAVPVPALVPTPVYQLDLPHAA